MEKQKSDEHKNALLSLGTNRKRRRKTEEMII